MSEKKDKKKKTFEWYRLETDEYQALLEVVTLSAVEIEKLKIELENIYKILEELKNGKQEF